MSLRRVEVGEVGAKVHRRIVSDVPRRLMGTAVDAAPEVPHRSSDCCQEEGQEGERGSWAEPWGPRLRDPRAVSLANPSPGLRRWGLLSGRGEGVGLESLSWCGLRGRVAGGGSLCF